MKLARPVGMALSVISEETAIGNFKAKKYGDQKIFVVVKSPSTLLKLLEIGENIPKIIIGGTVTIPDGIVLSNRAMASKEDVEVYKKIAKYHVPMKIQYVPADRETSLSAIVDLDH